MLILFYDMRQSNCWLLTGCSSILKFTGSLGLGEFDGIPLVPFGQLKPLVQLLLELAVANLLQDVRVPGLVNLECFLAVRADNFMHEYLSFAFVICLSAA